MRLHRLDRILVPVDFSAASDEAILTAKRLLSKSTNPCLILFHVVEALPSFSVVDGIIAPEIVGGADLKLAEDEIRRMAMRHEGAIPITVKVEIGTPVQAIARKANTEDVDMVIMPSHGRSGLKRLLLGSVAEGVLDRVHRPVWIVKTAEEKKFRFSIRCIVVGYRDHHSSSETLRMAETLALEQGSRLVIVHALPPAGEAMAPEELGALTMNAVDLIDTNMKLRWRDRGRAPRYDIVVRPGRPWEVLANASREASADLVVVGSRIDPGHPLGATSVTPRHLVHAAACPVLSVNRLSP